LKITQTTLEELYEQYNRRQWVHPDPLEFLYRYEDLRDREIVGLVASSLAYGRVTQILRSVALILGQMDPSPYGFLRRASYESLRRNFRNFKHRFTTGEELAGLLLRVKQMLEQYGSLQACFLSGFRDSDATILNGLTHLVDELNKRGSYEGGMLIPSPRKGSACKRVNLFLRWMVRSDNVDPGGWHRIPPSKLIIPLDTHMHKISILLGLTCRRQPNMKTALEITEAFRTIAPDDPVRYDFTLTRLGIREDLDFKLITNQEDYECIINHPESPPPS
jgi:uncharacterized protein (TIGR02757 family)